MNLTIRNLPEDLINHLRKLAKRARRSLNSEILFQLEQGVKTTPSMSNQAMMRKQKSALKKIVGKWEDDRSSQEIIRDIYESRTLGREVNL